MCIVGNSQKFRQYSTNSTYKAFWLEAIQFQLWQLIQKTWAPKKCQFFLWLALHNRYWTTDRLAKRNMPHPEKCVFLDQEEEDIQHILIGYVLSRKLWFSLLNRVGLSMLAPQTDDTSVKDRWIKSNKLAPTIFKKGLNSPFVIGAWMIWKQHNDGVFNGASPSVSTTLALIEEEEKLWSLDGARELPRLPATPVPVATQWLISSFKIVFSGANVIQGQCVCVCCTLQLSSS